MFIALLLALACSSAPTGAVIDPPNFQLGGFDIAQSATLAETTLIPVRLEPTEKWFKPDEMELRPSYVNVRYENCPRVLPDYIGRSMKWHSDMPIRAGYPRDKYMVKYTKGADPELVLVMAFDRDGSGCTLEFLNVW